MNQLIVPARSMSPVECYEETSIVVTINFDEMYNDPWYFHSKQVVILLKSHNVDYRNYKFVVIKFKNLTNPDLFIQLVDDSSKVITFYFEDTDLHLKIPVDYLEYLLPPDEDSDYEEWYIDI